MPATPEELLKNILALKDVEALDHKTAIYQVPFSEIYFFLRPTSDDLVWATSTKGAPRETAVAIAQRTLAKASEFEVPPVDSATVVEEALELDPFGFDAFLVLGPEVKQFSAIKDDAFLRPITFTAQAIHRCEFCGDETVAEARARFKHLRYNDMNREPQPAISGRYQKQDGARSKNKHLGVTHYDKIVGLIREIERDGGMVEIENFEHARCVFSTTRGSGEMNVTLGDATKVTDLAGALKIFDALVFKGAAAAGVA